jgi:hypothetical protein
LQATIQEQIQTKFKKQIQERRPEASGTRRRAIAAVRA